MLTAAATDRLLGSWAVTPTDPLDSSFDNGPIVGSRGEWLYENETIAKAVVETILQGTVGPSALEYRSAYQEADGNDQVSDAERSIRARINRRLKCATLGTRFDACGVLTRKGMSETILASTIMNGDAWSVRGWKPNRRDATHATCWRIIHPSRISNPFDGADTPTRHRGIELDADGAPMGIHVRRHHPASRIRIDPRWDYVPWHGPDGSTNVTHHAVLRIAGQLRPVGWFGPVIQLLRLFGRTLEAKTVADSLRASMGMIIECDDPDAMARKDRNGAVLNGTTKILPGKVYYVRKGTTAKPFEFSYQGGDFQQWYDVVLTNICASFSLPMEFITQRLTRSSLAASRVALLQAYRTFTSTQNDLIESTENPWNHSIIREDLVRGELGIDTPDEQEALDRLLQGVYDRPERYMPDPQKEAQAAQAWYFGLGRDLTSIYGEAGLNLEDSARQREQDDELLQSKRIVLAPPGAGAPGQSAVPNATGDAAAADSADSADNTDGAAADGSADTPAPANELVDA